MSLDASTWLEDSSCSFDLWRPYHLHSRHCRPTSISSSVLPLVSGTVRYMLMTAKTPTTANEKYVLDRPA